MELGVQTMPGLVDSLPLQGIGPSLPPAAGAQVSGVVAMAGGTSVADRLKEIQRTDVAGRQAWGEWCDAHGGGIRDPAKHAANFVQKFLEAYQNGELSVQKTDDSGSLVLAEPGGKGGGKDNRDNSILIDLLKEGQRRSQHWKHAWSGYCQQFGGGVNDPSKHKTNFLVSFLDYLGQHGTLNGDGSLAAFPGFTGAAGAAAAGGSSGSAVGSWAGMDMGAASMGATWGADALGMSAAKRPRLAGAVHGLLPPVGAGVPSFGMAPSSGDAEKDKLVMLVKGYQRQSEANRDIWQDYCDKALGGVRDPARQKKEVLQQFLLLQGQPIQ